MDYLTFEDGTDM